MGAIVPVATSHASTPPSAEIFAFCWVVRERSARERHRTFECASTVDGYRSRGFKRDAAHTLAMLAIAGGKGGCGKTTTAVGLARAFASLGADPLVVDADLDMPDLHHRTGVDREPGIAAAVEHTDPRTVAQPG